MLKILATQHSKTLEDIEPLIQLNKSYKNQHHI